MEKNSGSNPSAKRYVLVNESEISANSLAEPLNVMSCMRDPGERERSIFTILCLLSGCGRTWIILDIFIKYFI